MAIKKAQPKTSKSTTKPVIVIATGNQHKFEQLITLMQPLTKKYDFKNLKQIGYTKPIVEDGETFEDNCFIKANQLSKDTGCITIADDSGICIKALNDRPGVYSARYAGEGAGDDAIRNKVLNEMKDVPANKRQAKFVAVVACVLPNGKKYSARGEIEGTISDKIVLNPNGDNGLTYDPLFIPKGYKKTMSCLTNEERVGINHRGIACRALLKKIKNI